MTEGPLAFSTGYVGVCIAVWMALLWVKIKWPDIHQRALKFMTWVIATIVMGST